MRKQTFGKRGVTIVELLVVIVIAAILAGLLLVAIHFARATARRTACRSNLRQLSFAMRMYVDARRDFPKAAMPGHAGGWSVALMPFLEEQPLADSLTANSSLDPAEISPLALVRPSLFSCPAVFEETPEGAVPRAHYAFQTLPDRRRKELSWEVFDMRPDTTELWITGPMSRLYKEGPHNGEVNRVNRDGVAYD